MKTQSASMTEKHSTAIGVALGRATLLRSRTLPARAALLAALVLGGLAAHAAGPTVSNVRAAQRPGTTQVDIYYDLADPDSSALTVSVALSTNGGASYFSPGASVSGAGAGLAPASGKKLTWNAGVDLPAKLFSNVRVSVTASDDTVPAGMANIPAGSFQMGDNLDGSNSALPVHTVYVSAFAMDRYPVTKALWDDVYNWAITHGYSFEYGAQGKAANHPAHSMTWYDAAKWCNARSEKEGRTPAYCTDAGLSTRYRSGQVTPYVNWNGGYRLPTEAEWEKAARGGASGQRFPWGNTITHSQANYYSDPWDAYDLSPTRGYHPSFQAGGYPYTSPVDYFAPNGYGLYDMAGNVMHWCWDWYGSYSSGAQTDPRGPSSGSYRVLRVGMWKNSAIYCRAADRNDGHDPAYRYYGSGFRSVLSLALSSTSSSTGVSTIFTVDLQVRSVAVSGRVLDAASRAPVSGATVTLAGQSTSSSGAGQFSFASVFLSGGNTLAVSKSGYATYTGTVPAPAGATAVAVSDILLQPFTAGNSNKPIVTKVEAGLKGIFLSGLNLNNEFTATVNWNGKTPGGVRFFANDLLVSESLGAGTEYTASIDMAGPSFSPSFDFYANRVRVNAWAADGVSSDPTMSFVAIVPLPDPLKYLTGQQWLPPAYIDSRLRLSVSIPEPPAKVVLTLPVIGKFGAEIAFAGELDYEVVNGGFEFFLGAEAGWREKNGFRRPYFDLRRREARLYLGQTEIKAKFGGGAKGRFTLDRGLEVQKGYGVLEIGGRFEIARVGVFDLASPGASSALASLTFGNANAIIKNSTVGIYALPSIGGELTFDFSGITGGELTGKLGIEAAYEPDWFGQKWKIYVGGEPSVTFGFPGDLIKRLRFRAYAGIEVQAWILKVGPFEYVFADCTYSESGLDCSGAGASIAAHGAVSTGVAAMRPVSREYLLAGPEGFVGSEAVGRFKTLSKGSGITPLEAFRTIARDGAGGLSPKGPSGSAGSTIFQADLMICTNLFMTSQPALAGRSNELMLLYVTDNGSTNNLQFTDIRGTRFDGTNWSEPTTIQTNTQAEFSPQVAYDGNGDAIAVWERVADPNFNQTNLTAMAAQMEIVWAKWNHTSGAWSTPASLTSNGYLDHAPLLCGPMAGGGVLATWTANTANLLMGTNGAGSQVLWAQWNPGSQSWSAPQTLLADLPYRLSQSLSGVSNLAVYAWTRDMDGVLTNAADQQVFYAEWSGSVWGAPTQMTTNTVGNRNARVVVSPNTAGASVEGFEPGNFSSQPWSFTGNVPWAVQSGTVGSGSQAAASGTIADNQTSGMALSLNCQAGTISFAYSVSSEGNYDYLRFYLDGVEQGQWSGTVGWTTVSYPVTAGPHTFEWRYTKDGSISSGSDKAWVDDINLPVAAGQQFYVVWQQGTNLVLSADKGVTSSLVRADSQTAGFADYAMTIGPAGNLALLWQEMSQAGSDAHYSVLDPVSAAWSKDAQLFNDPPLERSFAPVWDAVGNLTVAYNKVEMLYTNKTVKLEGGGSVTITNVPQPGRVDLCVTKRRLIKDVSLAAGDFTVSAENYLPGAAVTLSATLRNSGDLAVSNAVVAFYDGNPTNSGVFITNVAISGWLEGAATNTVSALWVVPEPAANHVLYAVADLTNVITEFDEANNTQSLRIGGIDLAVSLVRQTAETNGALRVIAQVQNLGAPSATNSILAIRRAGSTNTPLLTVAVPLLEPGRLAQVALDLPAGTQPGGEEVYTLAADETRVTSDVDTNNNTASFAVNLWIDSDGDGIPDTWVTQHFGHATGHAGDNSRAQDDADGDGVSNLGEYLAGTSPRDPLSYLRITGISSGRTNGVLVTWGSTSNKLYSLQRSSSLSLLFGDIQQHILSTPPENAYLDSSPATMVILDEQHVLTVGISTFLNQPLAVPATVHLTDLSGIPYIEGIDFFLIPTGSRIEIRRAIGGRIPNGGGVLVDYSAIATQSFYRVRVE